MVLDWAGRFGTRTLAEHAARNPSSVLDRTPPAAGVDTTVEAVGMVLQGRWVALCPFGCRGAEYVNHQDPVFFCCECRNQQVGHRPVAVRLPDRRTVAKINRVLAARPLPQQRNWQPGETIRDLLRENHRHGDPVR